MNSKPLYWKGIFALSSLLILTLAWVNGGFANDDHFTVIELIARFGELPRSTQCWQCYHPKLYHLIVATFWNATGISSPFWKHVSAQLFSAGLGIGSLYLFMRFIRSLAFPELLKLLVFAFFAFNPRFIAISGQATNDTLVIFLGTLNLYALLKLFKAPSLMYSLIVILTLVLGAMSKLNFGVYFIGTVIVLGVLSLLHKNYTFSLRKGFLGTLVLGVGISATTFFFFNGYARDYRETGKLFTYNTPTYELPHLYLPENTYIPGILSVYSGFFKFHYFDLIKHPHLSYTGKIRQKHMHSHWSQVYARYYFLGFDNWPAEWRTDNKYITFIGKVSIALGLFPTLLLFLGLFITVREAFTQSWKENPSWIYLLYILGFLGFSVLFSLIGRTFVFMKAIYIFPGLLATIVPFLKGNARFAALFPTWGTRILWGFYTVLFLLLLIPVVYLLIQLA
jgi:hypothetical protein